MAGSSSGTSGDGLSELCMPTGAKKGGRVVCGEGVGLVGWLVRYLRFGK